MISYLILVSSQKPNSHIIVYTFNFECNFEETKYGCYKGKHAH